MQYKKRKIVFSHLKSVVCHINLAFFKYCIIVKHKSKLCQTFLNASK